MSTAKRQNIAGGCKHWKLRNRKDLELIKVGENIQNRDDKINYL